MLQMYKVFINDSPLFIHSTEGDKVHKINGFAKVKADQMDPATLYQITGHKLLKGLIFTPENDVATYWNEWKHRFINIEAAGGVVKRSDGKFLGIYRLQKWDLPKGKAEAGETAELTAVREVEEECGIAGVTIVGKLMDTYHVYPFREGFALKCTHWYLMNWNGSGELIPQTEEGIEELRWFSPDEAEDFCAHTYGSVAEVVRGVYGE